MIEPENVVERSMLDKNSDCEFVLKALDGAHGQTISPENIDSILSRHFGLEVNDHKVLRS